jgi:hypothetical protein
MSRWFSFSWLCVVAHKLTQWMGSPRLGLAQLQHHEGTLNHGIAFALELPPVPPAPTAWEPAIAEGRARLLSGKPFRPLAAAAARGACICALLEDGCEPGRPALLVVGMEGSLGGPHSGQSHRQVADAKAERIIAEELGRCGWREQDLLTR